MPQNVRLGSWCVGMHGHATQCTWNELNFLKSVITCYETWIFTWPGNKITVSVLEVAKHSKSKERLYESFEFQGHLTLSSISRVSDGTVGSERPGLTNCVNR